MTGVSQPNPPGRAAVPAPAGVASAPSGVLLAARGVTVEYPGVRALDNVSIEFRAGEIHAVVGENGAGKSTLMKVLSGLVRPTTGSVEIGGRRTQFSGPSDAIRAVVAKQEAMGFPVFSVGTNPNGPTKNIGGRIGHPISCGGVAVQAGDFVLADADGVVVIEKSKLASLIAAAEKKVDDEALRIEQINQGNTAASWLVPSLRVAGVLKEEETL